jgi:hypothetical protein
MDHAVCSLGHSQLAVIPHQRVFDLIEKEPRLTLLRMARNTATSYEWLEPISKSPEENYQASELDKAEKVLWVILPSGEDSTLPSAAPH